MTTVILAILLGFAGLIMTLVTGLLLLGPLRRPLRAALERASLRRSVSRQERGDARLASEDIAGALREFGSAFCFIVPRADPRLLAGIARLHTGLLSRFVTIGDDLPGARVQLFALAKVERLLDQWMDTQRQVLRRSPAAEDVTELRRHRRLTEQAIRELVSELLDRRRGPLVH